eukprot:GEMP01095413.1.p1 GENE.GEMP01095413.1~~GEMP01095413.1.p1  ORF type:complete len:174 (+),score=25.43 GEMP01095413.1:132-653(+)
MGGVVSAYSQAMDHAPFETNAYSSGAVACFSESVLHVMKPQPKLLNRLVKQYCIAFCITTPLSNQWFKRIDIAFQNWPSDMRTAVMKCICEQVIFAPAVNFAFFASQRLLENVDISEIIKEFREKFWEIQKSNNVFWAPVALVNYAFVPAPLRVMFGRVMSIFWMFYLIRKCR